MKRCPECRRDYRDDSLLYCLEDGASLIQGSVPSPDEPATAILSELPVSAGGQFGESLTRSQIDTTQAEPRTNVGSVAESHGPPANKAPKLIAAMFVAVAVLVGGFFGYRFLSPSSKQIESIAVMPFVNESGNADLEYLSDGMTETLINSLSQLPNVGVKGRSSVFRYKGKEPDSQAVGKDLGVQAVLYGRVIQHGDQLTLSLELLDAQTQNVIWSAKYERKQADLVSLQSEIARDVSNKLKTKLSGADVAKLEKNYTANSDAYQLYLNGLFCLNKRSEDGIKKAEEYFQQALNKDPDYALAYVGLADCYMVLGGEREDLQKAKAAALRALELDDSLGEAHAALGLAKQFQWDMAGAETEYKRAIELNPNYATAHHWYGEFLPTLNRFDDSYAEYQRALELDPLSLAISTDLGMVYYYDRQYDRSIEYLKKLEDMDSNFVRTHFYLAEVYDEKGMFAESLAEWQKGQILDGKEPNEVAKVKAQLEVAQKERGAKGYWQKRVDLATEYQVVTGYHPLDVAGLYARLGERDRAFEWLEKAYIERKSDLTRLRVAPVWDNLRSDPRFADLVRRVGLPQ
jgi:TolB-like protein/Tfp pilus assembly protein PilF